jgi:hypothetical protein
MKNILLPALFLTAAGLNGQTFDFYNQKIVDDTNGFVKNQNLTIKVIDINLFKYNVVVNSKPVNNNMDMPEIFKQYIKISEINKNADTIGKSEPAIVPKEMRVYNFDNLYERFIQLKSSEQFYSSLTALVGSNLSSEKIINYKKNYYQHFVDTTLKGDETDVPEILRHYSVLIARISYYGPLIKPGATEEQKPLIDTILKNTRKISASKVPEKLASLYGAINPQSFTFNSFLPRPNSDDVIVTINAKPNPDFNKGKDEIKIEVPFAVCGGWKIDFSTGIFISNIVNKDFVIKPIYLTDTAAGPASDSIVGYKLTQADKRPLSYGIAGYMHAYWRNSCNINGGILFGLAVDQNTQVRIMSGLSLILGRKERFIINGGMAFGKCKELSTVQDMNHLYKAKVDPVYSDTYRFGWFLGLSYNVGK